MSNLADTNTWQLECEFDNKFHELQKKYLKEKESLRRKFIFGFTELRNEYTTKIGYDIGKDVVLEK